MDESSIIVRTKIMRSKGEDKKKMGEGLEKAMWMIDLRKK